METLEATIIIEIAQNCLFVPFEHAVGCDARAGLDGQIGVRPLKRTSSATFVDHVLLHL
jgi:hypothetical protein